MVERFQATPDYLHVQPTAGTPAVILQWPEAELDELWSYVGQKENRQWAWITMDATTRQVIASHVVDRSSQSAQAWWEKVPTRDQEHATFSTDQYIVYAGIIPSAQPRTISKPARTTNHEERFNCTVRQPV